MRTLYKRVRWRVRKRKRPVAAAFLTLAVVLAAYALWPGPDLRAGSKKLAHGEVNVAIRLLSSYRVVYSVEDRAGSRLVLTTQTIEVRRPFDARVETRNGAPPGGKVVNVSVNGFARVREPQALLAIPPSAAPPDTRPEAFLADATRAGYARSLELRRVAGRTCRVYRIAGDPGASSLPRLSRSSATFTDVCFDAAGLVLETAAYTRGKLIDRHLAVHIDENPSLPDGAFDVSGPPIDPKVGGGTVKALTLDSRTPDAFWELLDPPAGFRHTGRYAVVPPQAALANPTQHSAVVATVDDVWTDGPNVLIVEQGGTVGGTTPFSSDPNAQRVHAGALGDGQLAYGLPSSEVRVRTIGGRFVIVEGTIAPHRLLQIARSLVKESGGTLTVR